MAIRNCLFASAALAACLISAPAAAQDSQPRDDLDCVIWAAVMGGQASDDDATMQTGLTAALGYFAGRYEAATGISIQDGVTEGQAMNVAENLPAYTQLCTSRMTAFGEGLQELGSQLARMGESTSGPSGK